MESQGILLKQKTLSLLGKGVILHLCIILSFSLIYVLYTELIANDYKLQRASIFDTFINSMLLSSFVTCGSLPPSVENISTFSRIILITNVILASLSRIWLIAY